MTIKEIQDNVITMPLLEGSHLPSSGLRHFEMVNTIEKMGASATLYMFEKGRERKQGLSIERVVYPYLESGIPAIIGIETEVAGHSVLIVGHTFDRDSWWQQAELGYFPFLAGGISWIPSYMWTPEFIIQDDNFGPYLASQRTLLGLFTAYVIVPTPTDCPIFLPGYIADSLAAGYLAPKTVARFFLSQTKVHAPWKETLGKLWKPRNMVLRPLILKKEEFISHINEVGLSQDVFIAYNEANLPDWVWLVEISVPELYSHHLKIGEVLINASFPQQHIQVGREPLLAIRLFDVTQIGNEFKNPRITKDTKPVKIVSRPTFKEQH